MASDLVKGALLVTAAVLTGGAILAPAATAAPIVAATPTVAAGAGTTAAGTVASATSSTASLLSTGAKVVQGVAAVGTVASSIYGRQEQRRGQRVQEKSSEIAAARERRAQFSEARKLRATSEVQSEGQGIGNSTIAIGAQQDITAQANRNIGYINETVASREASSNRSQAAANTSSQQSLASALNNAAIRTRNIFDE